MWMIVTKSYEYQYNLHLPVYMGKAHCVPPPKPVNPPPMHDFCVCFVVMGQHIESKHSETEIKIKL